MRSLNNLAALHDGGVERSVFNYVKQMKREDPAMGFDFVVHSHRHGMLEDELTGMGCRIFHVVPKTENFVEYTREMKKIMLEGRYDVFHCHQGYNSFYPLLLAKEAGIPVRLAHSHTCGEGLSRLGRMKKQISGRLTMKLATGLLATGDAAGRYMWGERNFEVFPPVVDTGAFLFCREARARKREELGVADRPVIGCVARLAASKNLLMLIDIFAEIKKQRDDAVLVLIGDGPMRSDIEEHIRSREVSDVILTGARPDASAYYNAFDAFVLPTLFEGLGMVFVEAQINGLMCYAPAGAVPEQARICDGLTYIPEGSSPAEWAAEVVRRLKLRDSAWEQEYAAVQASITKGAENYDTEKKGGELRKRYAQR